jgi:protein PhnA
MSDSIQCTKCKSENVYQDGNVWICPDCGNEWVPSAQIASTEAASDIHIIKDAFGNILNDGDSVTLIKELRIKGSNSAVKVGTKVKNIRLTDAGDGHDISCRIDGFGAMNLKSEFVKKVIV